MLLLNVQLPGSFFSWNITMQYRVLYIFLYLKKVSWFLVCSGAATKSVLYKKVVFKNSAIFTKNICVGVCFNKVAGLKACKKRLQRRGFSVNIVKCLRTTMLKNICEQLLLFVCFSHWYNFAFNYVVINNDLWHDLWILYWYFSVQLYCYKKSRLQAFAFLS